jgi:hypothetical protein
MREEVKGVTLLIPLLAVMEVNLLKYKVPDLSTTSVS